MTFFRRMREPDSFEVILETAASRGYETAAGGAERATSSGDHAE
jgi:hypothetical protein